MFHKGLFLLVAVLLAVTPLAADCPAADCIFVDGNACPGPGAGSELDPFCTIQDAYNAAKLVT